MNIGIVGGGSVGLASALWLSSYGHAVTLYERRQLGSGAMAAAAGILGAQAESSELHAAFDTFVRARALWAAWAATRDDASRALGYRGTGVLRLVGEAGAPALEAMGVWQRAYGLPAEWLAEDALHERFPMVGPAHLHALWLPEDAQVEPSRVAASWREELVRAGCTLYEHCTAPPLALLRERHDRVLLSGGVGTAHWLPNLGLVPVRGQLLEKELPHAPQMPVLVQDHIYAVPRGDTRVVVGATVEPGRDDEGVEAQCAQQLELAVAGLWPSLGQSPTVSHWAGVRPYLPGGPVVREVEPGLWVATGHHRNGILLALQAGEEVCQKMLGLHAAQPAQAAIEALVLRLSRG